MFITMVFGRNCERARNFRGGFNTLAKKMILFSNFAFQFDLSSILIPHIKPPTVYMTTINVEKKQHYIVLICYTSTFNYNVAPY